MIWLLKLIRVFTKTRYRFRDGVRQHKHGLFGTWRPGWFRTAGAVEAVAATDLPEGQPVTMGWDLGGQDCHCAAAGVNGELIELDTISRGDWQRWIDYLDGRRPRNRLKELRPMIRSRGGR